MFEHLTSRKIRVGLLDFGDGAVLHWQHAHRWRLWRRPRRSFD